MKRYIKSKNGFTLIEIVIVVSIIIILSTATFVGIDQVLDRANRNAQDLEENHGAHFEEEAWATVKNLSVDVDSFKETSETSIDPTDTSETSEEETTPTSTLSPNEKDQEFLDRKQELLDMGYLESEITIIYGDDGHIKSMSWRSTRRGFANGSVNGGGDETEETKVVLPPIPSNLESTRPVGAGQGGINTSITPGVNAPGVKCDVHYGGGNISFGNNGADSLVVHLPDGISINTDGNGLDIIDLGNGYYRVNATNNATWSVGFSSDDGSQINNNQDLLSQIYVVEVMIHKY